VQERSRLRWGSAVIESRPDRIQPPPSQALTRGGVQVECPLQNVRDNQMVFDMLWSDPALASPVPSFSTMHVGTAPFRPVRPCCLARSAATGLHCRLTSVVRLPGPGGSPNARRSGLWTLSARLSEVWRVGHGPVLGAALLPARLSGARACARVIARLISLLLSGVDIREREGAYLCLMGWISATGPRGAELRRGGEHALTADHRLLHLARPLQSRRQGNLRLHPGALPASSVRLCGRDTHRVTLAPPGPMSFGEIRSASWTYCICLLFGLRAASIFVLEIV
jgi:hypothetical protein